MFDRIVLATTLAFAVACACEAQVAEQGSLKPSAEQEMQERITRAKNKVGWPDPELGRGALDAKEAAKYAEMKHLFKRPHFNKPTPEFATQWEKLASYPIPEWMLDGKFGVYTHWGPSQVPEYTGAGNYMTCCEYGL